MLAAAWLASIEPVRAQEVRRPVTTPSGRNPPQGADGTAFVATQALLAEHLGRDSLGYVAGILGDEGRTVVTAGQPGAADLRKLDGDSIFEIGSVTKVFTALLLAEMALRGEVALADPVADYLPVEGRPLPFDGKAITLLDLVTHTSGLPRLPGNLNPHDPANPYADYAAAQLYRALSTEPPGSAPGSRFEYSNLGFGLLGHVLALRAGRSYEELVVSRICDPLGLPDTRITLTPEMRSRLVPGHDEALAPVPGWDWQVLAGAGALHSTTNDLLGFLDACRGRRGTPLAHALASLLEVRRPTGVPMLVAAEGWFVLDRPGDELVWKDGGTYGYSSLIGWSPRTGRAAVLLANTFSESTTPQLGLHMIDPRFPPPRAGKQGP